MAEQRAIKPPPLDLSSLALPPLPGGSVGSPTATQTPLYMSSTRPRPSFSATGGMPPAQTHARLGFNSPSSAPGTSAAPTSYFGSMAGIGSASATRFASPMSSSAVSYGFRSTSANGPPRTPDARPLPRVPQQPAPSSTLVPQPATTQSAARRLNPLEDLIETETLYVDDLSVIIKRVAAAWSRTNFPPPALDTMFRAIEGVYRTNKNLLSKLDEIGPNPASPKALGDLLMRLIPDISPAYAKYASTIRSSFDLYGPVQSNPDLAPVLDGLSWPNTIPRSEPQQRITLDTLFALPKTRLTYYRKLYTRLLKSTQEGRSDHGILLEANAEIDRLLQRCTESAARPVGEGEDTTLPLFARRNAGAQSPISPSRPDGPTHAVATSQSSAETIRNPSEPLEQPSVPSGGSEERSSGESARGDSSASSFHSLRSSSATGASTANTSAMTHIAANRSATMYIDELERRLSTDRVLDIFTMTPKKCKLQIAPPGLPFQRQIRRSADVSISFVPSSDPRQREVVYRNAHILLLTDLFLVCRHMTAEDRSRQFNGVDDGPDMWLMFPPLAGKHLRVAGGASKNELEVTIMRKEKLVVRTADAFAAGEWKAAFEDAIAFGVNNGHAANRADSTSSRNTTQPGGATIQPGREPLRVDTTGSSSDSMRGRGQGHMPDPGATSPVDALRSASPVKPELRLPSEPFASAPPSRQQPYGDPRRAFSGNVSPSYPPRAPVSASSGSSAPYPMSPAYPPSDYTQRSSPSAHGHSGRSSPFGASQQALQSAPPAESARPPRGPSPFDRSLHHSESVKSTSSFASQWTERSFPDPPPLPGKGYGQFETRSMGFGGARGSGPTPSSRSTNDLLSPGNSIYRSKSADGLREQGQRQFRMPSARIEEARSNSAPGSAYGPGVPDGGDDFGSPPCSPTKLSGAPERTTVTAQMRCKLFLQQNHGQWKAVGTGKLKLYLSSPSMTKQLVVEHDKSNKTVISTIIMTDAVECVGKTGVAVELSDKGDRTGIIYMLQMKTAQAAAGLFEQLLVGSDRAKRVTR
ncbi:hypothetical protein OIV83_005545 [Microbotryomycetes sp. JL201]|nr:hypothetical protein OIV83_005545 [Microbotryomycetes sp. JL201]